MWNRKGVLVGMVCAGCLCVGVKEASANWAAGIAITNEAAFFETLDLSGKELSAVRTAVAKEDWSAAKEAWGAYVDAYVAPRWIWSYRDLGHISSYLKARGEWVADTDAADALLNAEDGAMLNGNHQDFGVLSRAYMVTRDPKYAEAYARLLREWIAGTPVTPVDGRGSWHRLVVHQRVKAWFEAMNQLVGAPAYDAELRYDISRALVEHARWLHRNPRNRRFIGNNIQTKMLFGLSYATMMLPEAREAGDWWDLLLLRLGQHMDKGVFPDGAYIELTPGYASTQVRYWMDIMLLAKKNGVDASHLFARHEKMYEFHRQVSLPGGSTWNIADSSFGIGGNDVGGSTLLAAGALLYDRSDLRYLGTAEVPADLIWKFPAEKLARYATMPSTPPAFLSHMMPYAQYGTMRTGWDRDSHQLFFDCAPSGGPHTHADALQVLLYSNGRTLLVDPGTCGYKEPDRPYYLSAQAHNILLVDGQGVGRHARPEVVTWSVKPGAVFTAGKVNVGGCTQQRSVLFAKPDYWLVVDHVTGQREAAPTLSRLFHLTRGPVQQQGHSVRTTFAEGGNVWLHAPDGAALEMGEALLSADAEGNKDVMGPLAEFKTQTALPAALSTLIVPFTDDKEIPEQVEQIDSGDSETVALRIRFADGRTDWLAVAPTERALKAGPFTGTGMAMCVRTDAQGNETAFEVFGVEPLARGQEE